MARVLYVLFVLSGAAGLIYESIWSRYLGLFVGHDAYAQIIVLFIFLGGMSLGAMVVSRVSERIRQPLYGYAAIELVVGGLGIAFHGVFQGVTAWAYESVYPALAGSWALPVAKWGIAGALLLPQSVLLGTTFPLMSAGVIRLDPSRPGRTLSLLYFSNSLGAAIGVLVAGFYLLAHLGLPGTLATAAVLNWLVAAGAVGVALRARSRGIQQAGVDEISSQAKPESRFLYRLLLFTSFGTAIASFIYEIDWLRMLALALGSATHSFELMLSAFILGLALGAFWVRSRVDRFRDPVTTLGIVQWMMGGLALATLLLYTASFHWLEILMAGFTRTDAGYATFALVKYGLCLAVMLPATFCAGMTLPLITQILVTGGFGERAIGAVYSWNTLGSIIGVILGGLILMPTLGLKGMLLAGALLDMSLGVLLLTRRPRFGWIAGLATVGAAVAGIATPGFDRIEITGGIFRNGKPPAAGRQLLFYADGRTATVSGYSQSDWLVLATNGKTDASLGPVWTQPCDFLPRREPLVGDDGTQALVPLVTMAHAPRARSAAIIGHGSGMSSHFLLGSPYLRNLVTIEIEPQMVAGSRIFYPANARAFEDPRSHMVIDDAKSYFASAHRRYDIIISEPSNPWVSGVSGLFTDEFYARVRQYLSDDGVFGQWLQVYEMSDDLVLTVLAAIHKHFPSYEVYIVSAGDLLIVASKGTSIPKPDWGVTDFPAFQGDLCRFIPLTPSAFDALHLVGRQALSPLLDTYTPSNSDFFPVLDLRAEESRYRHDVAHGFLALATDWFNLLSSISRHATPSAGEALAPFPESPRVRERAVAGYLRAPSVEALANDDLQKGLRRAEFQWEVWQARLAADPAPTNWKLWLDQARLVHRLRNGGAAGMEDDTLHAAITRFLDRHDAPGPARDVVAFRHSIATWDFAEAARVADRLAPLLRTEPDWIDIDEFRDGATLAKLNIGDTLGARNLLAVLEGLPARDDRDLRSQLLHAYLTAATTPKAAPKLSARP